MHKAESPTMKFSLPTCFTANAQFAAERVQVNEETGDIQTQEDQIIESILQESIHPMKIQVTVLGTWFHGT